MRFEHIALNVPDPVAMAAWWQQHLGFHVVREGPPPANARFVSDDGGVCLELYCNPADDLPPYGQRHLLQFHLALLSNDPERDRARLVGLGARAEAEARSDDGDLVLTLRDPWDIPFQLVRRGRPLGQAHG